MWIGNKINKLPPQVPACVYAFLFSLCDSPPNVHQPCPSVLLESLGFRLDKVPTSVC